MSQSEETFYRLTDGTLLRLTKDIDEGSTAYDDLISDESPVYVRTYESRGEFQHAADELFGASLAPKRVNELVAGGLVKLARPVRYVLGIERYRHGGDRLALCQEGNFCDRQWDVSPIVGWVIVKGKDLARGTDPRDAARGILDVANDVLAGNVWEYHADVIEHGRIENVGGLFDCIGDQKISAILSQMADLPEIQEEIDRETFEAALSEGALTE